MLTIRHRPIGVIRTPFVLPAGCPIQPRFSRTAGAVELDRRFAAGLRGITRFSHVILIYSFHRTDQEQLAARPFLDRARRGIFTIRSPHRPNRIGLSVVRLLSRRGARLRVTGVDMLDRTPLLDIKPYVPGFDSFPRATSGWLASHLKGGCAAAS
jgi:tRNA-Thr(GGU) m(6)t(6)A37 methyltransferase TsaA